MENYAYTVSLLGIQAKYRVNKEHEKNIVTLRHPYKLDPLTC